MNGHNYNCKLTAHKRNWSGSGLANAKPELLFNDAPALVHSNSANWGGKVVHSVTVYLPKETNIFSLPSEKDLLEIREHESDAANLDGQWLVFGNPTFDRALGKLDCQLIKADRMIASYN